MMNTIKNNKSLKKDNFKCNICTERFDSGVEVSKFPRKLCCGHSYCLFCLEAMLSTDEKAMCPACKNQINYETVEEIPINFEMIRCVQDLKSEEANRNSLSSDNLMLKSQEQLCYKHKKEKKYECFDCKMFACYFCATAEHNTCRIFSLEDILVAKRNLLAQKMCEIIMSISNQQEFKLVEDRLSTIINFQELEMQFRTPQDVLISQQSNVLEEQVQAMSISSDQSSETSETSSSSSSGSEPVELVNKANENISNSTENSNQQSKKETSSTDSNSTDNKKVALFTPKDSQQIFIGNIHHNISDDYIRDQFSKYGKVLEVRINRTRYQEGQNINASLNFGFLVFEKEESVQKCLASRPITLNNYRINVEQKRPAPSTTGSQNINKKINTRSNINSMPRNHYNRGNGGCSYYYGGQGGYGQYSHPAPPPPLPMQYQGGYHNMRGRSSRGGYYQNKFDSAMGYIPFY